MDREQQEWREWCMKMNAAMQRPEFFQGLKNWTRDLAIIFVALWLLLFWLSHVAHAEAPAELSGYPQVIDGDSLRIGQTEIRLYGIDAPEWKQKCRRHDPPWWRRALLIKAEEYPCGVEARDYLQSLILTPPGFVLCWRMDTDLYNRMVAVCYGGLGVDLGEQMVAAGHAVVYRLYAHLAPELIERYAQLEREAKAAQRGVWGGSFDRPAQWRRMNPSNR